MPHRDSAPDTAAGNACAAHNDAQDGELLPSEHFAIVKVAVDMQRDGRDASPVDQIDESQSRDLVLHCSKKPGWRARINNLPLWSIGPLGAFRDLQNCLITMTPLRFQRSGMNSYS